MRRKPIALSTIETELRVIAALASIGLSAVLVDTVTALRQVAADAAGSCPIASFPAVHPRIAAAAFRAADSRESTACHARFAKNASTYFAAAAP